MAEWWQPPPDVEEYRVMRLLGRGAMGEVWLAHDTLLDRPVAMKFIPNADVGDAARGRFFSEARAIARLDHPNVIRIHRVGEVEGRPFLVSEYLRGDPLDRIPRPVPIDDALPIALELARGLGAAHRRGVLHRDVKPANAFRTQEGQIKLLDFGLAKLRFDETLPEVVTAPAPPSGAPTVRLPSDPVEQAGLDVTMLPSDSPSRARPDAADSAGFDATMDGSAASIAGRPSSKPRSSSVPAAETLHGAVMGTPVYLAPELWDGRSATPASDVYALGASIYELLTGSPPHVGSSLVVISTLARTKDALPVEKARPEVPAALARVVNKCIRRVESERYPSAEEVCTELESLARQTSSTELPTGNPYRGLGAFDEHHNRMFFGRDREIVELLDRLRSEPWLVVAGRSGAGKSSIVRAGVIPRIKERSGNVAVNVNAPTAEHESWRVIVFVPGERPLTAFVAAAASVLGRDEAALAAALDRDPGSLARELRADGVHRTLLVIDQLEELATISDANERDRFVEALVPTMVLSPGIRVVATVRSDFVGQLDSEPRLARMVARSLFLLGPLDRDGLRAAITAPAAAHGVTFENEADVDALVGVAANEAGGLPLLEFALAKLWELRDTERSVIPRDALTKIGGVAGALARHADDVFGVLSPSAKTATRRILLRIVSADRTRTRRTEDELLGGEAGREAARTALDALVQGRLLAVGESDRGVVYELAHEALLTHWTRLRVWLDEADIDHATRERIELAAADWDRQGRPSDGLWRGQQIAAVADFPLDELGATARELIARSKQAARRTQVVRRSLVVGGLTVLAIWFGVVLYLNSQARDARDQARSSAVVAQSRTAALYQDQGRQALIRGEPMRAVAYFVEAYAVGQRGSELQFLFETASDMLDGVLGYMTGHTDKIWDVTWSPDGTRVATASVDGTVRVWRASDSTEIATLRGHKEEVIGTRWSPDGKRIATASWDNTGAIWDAETGERLHVLEGHQKNVMEVEWLPDGKRVVTASVDTTAKVWSAETGALLATLQGHTGRIAFVSVAGNRIVTGGLDKLGIVWDATTYQETAKLVGHTAGLWRGTFSRDGSKIATGGDSADRSARVWDAATGALLATFAEHTRTISQIAFSPDGQRVATSSEDGTVRVWNAASGEAIAKVDHGAPVHHMTWSSDGARLAAGSGEVASLVRAEDGVRLWTFVGHSGLVLRAVFSPDGTRLATAGLDQTVRLWDARRTVTRVRLGGAERGVVWDARYSPTGDRIATAFDDRTETIWDPTGKPLAVFDEHLTTERKFHPRFVRWGPSGDWIVTAFGPRIEQRDATTKRVLHTYPATVLPSGEFARRAVPTRDGKWLAITDQNDVKIFPIGGTTSTATLRGHTGLVHTVDWSPDGTLLVTASADRTVRLWDARGTELAKIPHRASVDVAYFSPDGERFVTAAEDRSITVWNTATRIAVAACDEGVVAVSDLAWSPDGARLASASRDGAVKIWSASTGRLLFTVGQHHDEVSSIAFHPSGKQLAVAGDTGTLIWELSAGGSDLPTLVERAKCRVPYHVERGLLTKRVIDRPCLQ